VKNADADYRTGTGEVSYDPDETSPERIVETFNRQSLYRASVETERQRKQGKR
jgi:hypothetical protein